MMHVRLSKHKHQSTNKESEKNQELSCTKTISSKQTTLYSAVNERKKEMIKQHVVIILTPEDNHRPPKTLKKKPIKG